MIIDSYELLFKNSPIEMVHKKNVIYKYEHLDDGKIYIGKTVQELCKRLRQHTYGKCKSPLDRAIKKYGLEKFDIEVIAEADTEEELNALEMFFIEFYGCKIPDGYNLTDGGEGCAGRIVSEKTRKKLSKSNMGKSHPVTEETRKLLSDTRTNKRVVVCIETGQTFKSLADAAKWAGVTDSYMCKLCKGEKATGGGYHWRYEDEEYNFVEKNYVQPKKQIICLETQKIFESAKDAAESLGVSETSIRNACRGKSHTSGGYHWAYIDKTPTPKSKKVVCMETGQIFESAAEAERWLGVSEGSIGKVCRGVYKTAKGYHWKFADDDNKNEIEKPIKPRQKRVVCVETNEIFEKMKDAAKWAGIGKSALRRACNDEEYAPGGYHWKFADDEN